MLNPHLLSHEKEISRASALGFALQSSEREREREREEKGRDGVTTAKRQGDQRYYGSEVARTPKPWRSCVVDKGRGLNPADVFAH